MRRLFATRYGFFGLAAIVCWSLLLVIDAEFRWVAFSVGCLYALLAGLFLADEISRSRSDDRQTLGRG
jgi:hypothetical protein